MLPQAGKKTKTSTKTQCGVVVFSSDNNTTLGLCQAALGCGNEIFIAERENKGEAQLYKSQMFCKFYEVKINVDVIG